MKKKMLINVADEEESRVAIVEDGTLEEFTIEVSSREQIKGNIYNGIVVKVEPSLQAAFIDYGGRRHGFLPMGEIHENWHSEESRSGDRERRPRIQDALKRNQKILLQVTKEEMGNKGASLSTYISLPGRYLVLMPASGTTGGVSRKIEDEEERKKLKDVITQLNPPSDMGIIVRTAGLNRNKTELQRDFTYLQRLWTSIHEKSQESPAPALIYQEHDLVLRSIRDYFTPDIQEVLIDHREVYLRARDFFQAVMPRYQGRVKLYRERKPLFAKYQLEEQIEAIYTHKVELKSGGSIVIDPTEALVSIDVNSGRATKEKGIEETAFKTNLEAAQEVARQLRLRDLGGLIVVDFIDMRTLKHIQEVEKALRQAVKRDKARTQLSRISQFGLLELSRQRLKPTIIEGNYLQCPHCEGSGLIKSAISLALLVLRRIRTEAARENLESVNAVLPMETAAYLLNQKRKELFQLEEDYRITINVTGNLATHHNEYNLEFKRREIAEEASVAAERGVSRESTEAARAPRSRREVKTPEVVPVKPAMTASDMPTDSFRAPKSNDAALPRAISRGRIFWRLVAASRHAEIARGRPRSRGGAGHSRSGRNSSGRFGRRTRTWWRRRTQTTPPSDASPPAEAPRVNENLG
ncbi:MAG: Rne/Rng family ribonuclease [bacterium]|nr:Rne/Rng family ribonuclease [bacterium]